MYGPHPPETGGPASVVRDMARALSDRGVELTVVCRRDPLSGKAFRSKGEYRIISTKGWQPSTIASLGSVVDISKKSHVLHAQSYATACAGILLRAMLQKKLVSTLHTYYYSERREYLANPFELSLARTLERLPIERSDALVAVDKRIANWVRMRYCRPVDLTLSNNLYLSDFDKYDGAEKVHEWIVCPRHLYPKNGLHIAIRAMKEVTIRFPHMRMIIIGEGPERVMLEALAMELGLAGRIKFLGNLSRGSTIDIMAKARMTLVPSVPVYGLEEATSVAALESMAVGTPVIASAIGGLREIIQDGQTGLLVVPGSPNDLACGIARLLDDEQLETRLSKNGQQYVKANHDWRLNVKYLIELYRRLLP